MKRYLSLGLFLTLILTTILFLTGRVSIGEFFVLSAVWTIFFFMLMAGPETIAEINYGKTSIKRDVQDAREIRDEIEKIAKEFVSIIRMSAETTYLLASGNMVLMPGHEEDQEKIMSKIAALMERLGKFETRTS